MNGYYRAERTPDGRVIVLAPDGLTWETEPDEVPTLEAAQAYALALNDWLGDKPDASRVSPFFNPAPIGVEPTEGGLLSSIDKLFSAEDRLTKLSEAIRGQRQPQEEEVQHG